MMRQAVLVEPGRIEYREAEVPAPGPEEIVMKVERIGICGSDVHAYHGSHPNARYPLVQGHESSGTVYRIGENVSKSNLSPGDKITFLPQLVCGRCYPCRNGMYHICESLRVMGFHPPGAAQEYFVLPAANVVKLPDDMSFDIGALVEPTAVAVHAVSKTNIQRGQRVIVLGAGPIGNLVAQVAKARGAERVLATDLSDFRLDLARQCGIDYVLNPQEEDLTQAIQTYIGPDKADVIFECVGVQATIDQAIGNARKGSTVVLVAVFGKRPMPDLMLVQSRELCLVGTQMYQRVDYEQAIELITQDKVHLDKLITRHFDFTQYSDAYRYIEQYQDKAMKIALEF